MLEVLAAGPGYIVINKPAGVSVHNDPGADALAQVAQHLESSAQLRAITGWQKSFEPSPVHRLDKETSGCLLIALAKDAASKLQQAFENRTDVKKTYRAVVRGSLQGEGIWSQDLSDRAEGRTTPQGPSELRKTCETRYRVIRQNKFFSDIEIDLLTGRQHQIRRHAVLNGHVVINDTRYGDPKFLNITEKHYGVSRMMLHAAKLEVAGIRAEAPLPKEFTLLLPTDQK